MDQQAVSRFRTIDEQSEREILWGRLPPVGLRRGSKLGLSFE